MSVDMFGSELEGVASLKIAGACKKVGRADELERQWLDARALLGRQRTQFKVRVTVTGQLHQVKALAF
jgi:hypothetical protein